MKYRRFSVKDCLSLILVCAMLLPAGFAAAEGQDGALSAGAAWDLRYGDGEVAGDYIGVWTVANCDGPVPLLEAPDAGAAEVAKVPKWADVEAYYYDSEWFECLYGGHRGFISREFLTDRPGKYPDYPGNGDDGGETPYMEPRGTGFTKYNLTDDQLIQIARLCKQEQGSVAGAKAEASLMANQLETSTWRQNKYGTGPDGLYNWVRNGGWFSRAAYWMDNGSASSAIIDGVRDVLVNGNRTLAWYVDEHDCLSDIESISTGSVYDKSAYRQGVTIVNNIYGSTWTFWCFPDSNSDPFGYTASAYNAVGGRTQPDYIDDEKPVISNIQVTNVTSDGYTVTCNVSDNVGVTRVAFPTWTEPGGQDDILWKDGTISGNTATFVVSVGDHGNQRDCNYITHIYAYDAAGNSSNDAAPTCMIKSPIQYAVLDLNGWLDGAEAGTLGRFGTVDVYIDGVKVAEDKDDYYAEHPVGTAYEIKDIRQGQDSKYAGVYNGSLSGTLGASGAKVILKFDSYLPVEMTCEAKEKSYPEDKVFTKDDFIVKVTYADGTTVETQNYSFSSQNVSNGKHIVLVYYGEWDWGITAMSLTPIKGQEKLVEAVLLHENVHSFESPSATPVAIGHEIYPDDATEKGVFWEIEDTSVAQVNPDTGVIAPVAPGVTRVYCIAADGSGEEDDCIIIVHAKKALTLPAGLKAIDAEAFIGASTQEIVLPEGVQSIGARAFANCRKLALVIVPESVRNIGANAFAGCGDVWFIADNDYPLTDYAEDAGFNALILDDRDPNAMIIYNANGGQCKIGCDYVFMGERIGTLPVPTWENHEFLGWYDERGAKAADDMLCTAYRTKLTARWRANTCKITFDPNGGTCATGEKTVNAGEAIAVLPTAAWDYHRFDGWFTAPGGGAQVSVTSTFDKDTILYAHWTLNDFDKTWSDWSAEPAYASDNRQVETRVVSVQTGTKTTYSYSRYVYKGNTWNNVSYSSGYADARGWPGYWQYITLDYPLTQEPIEGYDDRYVGYFLAIDGATLDWVQSIWYKQVVGSEAVYSNVTQYRYCDRIK